MPVYSCRVGRPDGTVSVERIEAEDPAGARARLRELGYLIFSVRPQLTGWAFFARKRHYHFGQQEFLMFTQELSALLKAGIPILKSIDLLMDRASHSGFREALRHVRDKVKGGLSLSEAMGQHPLYFPELCVASLRSGEQTGTIVGMLTRYIAYAQRMIAVKSKIRTATVYPIFLIVTGVAVIVFLMLYVVPSFSEIYRDAKVELPLLTRWMLAVVGFSQRYGLWVVAAGVVVAIGLRILANAQRSRAWVHRWLLLVPFVGEGIRTQHIISLARTLSTTLLGGIPLVPALRMVQSSMTNQLFANRVAMVADDVTTGTGLARSMERSHLLPKLSIEMIEVGETAGALPQMLAHVADFHEAELDRQLQRLIWIEPAILIIMGAMVAFIVIAIYLPIFQLAGTIG